MKIIQRSSSIICTFIALFGTQTATALNYEVTPLVSDLVGSAPHVDPNLLNPWGLFFSPNGSLWVADNGSNLSTLYAPDGTVINFVIQANSAPSGAKFNSSSHNFLIGSNLPAKFLFSTESGTILGFNSALLPNETVIAADRSGIGAVYKGIETAVTCCQQSLLFATDFHNGRIDLFDTTFQFMGSFIDPTMPSGYAPFNIQNIGENLYVTYAKQLPPDNHDDEAGPGNGYVDIFNYSGTFIKRLISRGNLNSPWGLALAPSNFGEFSNALLVGNFGDGKINAYDPSTGNFLGQISDLNNNPIVIDGLWSLEFDTNGTLYFTSGPNNESDGLVGTISPL